jgi:putative ABC transport system permease protein
MIKNYFKIAFRNLTRHKAFSIINISGLAVGIAACLLLFTVVTYELSYEAFQPNYKHVYHVVTQDKFPDGITYTSGIPYPALEAFRLEFPQITSGALFSNSGSQVTVLGNNSSNPTPDKKFVESTGAFFADPQFFKVFTYNWLVGSPSVLSEPNNTVLTQKIAEKYFANWKDAMGQFLKLDNGVTVKVAGILEDIPGNTDFPLGIVTSFETVKANAAKYLYSTDWGKTTSDFQIFMFLPSNVSSQKVDAQLAVFSNKNYYNKDKANARLNFLQPLSEVHFDNRFSNFGDHVTNKSTLWTLSLIGIFIIIMACINFINLSTAQAVGRSKEVGIRKVLGSNRFQLFGQVLSETSLIVITAVIMAVAISFLCLPYIKHIASIHESLSLFNWQTAVFTFAIIIFITVIAGLYPALVLSGFNPALALKNKITSAIGGISLRRGLVVTQFAISQVLIIGTIVAISQMNFVKKADLGFNKDAVFVLTANTDSTVLSRQLAFKQQLLQLPGVQAVSFSSDVPSSDNSWGTNFFFNHGPAENYTLYFKCADEDYFKTFGLQFIAGHAYEHSDTMKDIVINETLVKKLGLKNANEAIGKDLRMGAKDAWRTIVGVVKDFKTNSLREEIKPTIIGPKKRFYGDVSVKIKSANLAKTKDAILKIWDKYYPEYATSSFFMDESINNFYQQEDQLSLLYKIFAGIAIFISCLGLYGLVSFMAVQRTKEIGIRKVLGASIQNIIYLFSKEFTILIFIGFLLAVPVAYYMMHGWLQNFVYRIKMNAGVFVIAVLISIIIAWLAVGYKSVKAALANPVKSLRSE